MPEVILLIPNVYSLRHETPTEMREEPLVQTAEFFENACPMGCRFIFPESDFDPRHLIGPSQGPIVPTSN